MTERRFGGVNNNLVLLFCLALILPRAEADGKTLVLLDNLNIRDTHSVFFRSLAGSSSHVYPRYLIYVGTRCLQVQLQRVICSFMMSFYYFYYST